MKIGVLAMQGAFIEHINSLKKLDIDAIPIRYKEELDKIDGIIIPGGESTAIGKLINIFDLKEKLKTKIQEGMPVWGTCAGMILLAKKISNSDVVHIGLMDIEVIRNAYGRQLGSFSVKQSIKGIDGKPFPMVFIRAPYIKEADKEVEILAKVDGKIVAAEQKNMLVTSFHPELTEDLRMHKYFIDKVKNH
ncbi:5'-phosphate synthase pdxT subunit [Caminicella sporogenes DSM 14501]|uniref:Pyridoxal 5'-phosphate synthase subunit PdxT n=1 Tax=Caminicella sporogenes DSM 14501 TaxID=1121266 RepID=A0A1M6TNM2_9FIRM|nr:pyridoxal 5'-phosphate synthase glutaminase subunit PdxT [Caminicella sporogenes]RKD24799.1 glutamine amidotransferase subunit PdxT [Caminicella sporogenes]SHK58496.1 5'-phosphate synthase pdxT subunit [Caminicella sporogenes DSM 14501]